MKDYTSGKRCPVCETVKTPEEFYRRKKDGNLSSYCKVCVARKGAERSAADIEKNGPKQKKPRKPMSEEVKRKLSESRKKWCRENPDKLPWRVLGNKAFASVPCQKLKDFLTSKGIQFVEEYQPNVEGRAFSLDIAFPDKLIAIEVNGNQHYERDGTLKPYYQSRHDLLEHNGWKVYELHYSLCYKLDSLETMIPTVLSSPIKVEFDYMTYAPREKKKYHCACGSLMCKGAKVCTVCRKKAEAKLLVSKSELESKLQTMTVSAIAKEFGVASGTVKKRAKKLGIAIQKRSWKKVTLCSCGKPTAYHTIKTCKDCVESQKTERFRSKDEVLVAKSEVKTKRRAAATLDISRGVLNTLIRKYQIEW